MIMHEEHLKWMMIFQPDENVLETFILLFNIDFTVKHKISNNLANENFFMFFAFKTLLEYLARSVSAKTWNSLVQLDYEKI